MSILLLALIAILVLSPLLPGPEVPRDIALPPPTPDDAVFRIRLARIAGLPATEPMEPRDG
jgi:hypothetical protein